MTDEDAAAEGEHEEHDSAHKRTLRERIHDHLVAAEVAAEDAAAYGWVTEAVEATEAAVDPAHELGKREPDDDAGDDTAGERQDAPQHDR